jgi:hypothetical protein
MGQKCKNNYTFYSNLGNKYDGYVPIYAFFMICLYFNLLLRRAVNTSTARSNTVNI